MSPKKIQLLFLCGICGVTLYFSAYLGIDLYRYFSLQKEAKATVSQWEIVPVKDRFALRATYGFQVEEKTWRSASTLSPPYYLNEFAAIAALKEMAKKQWSAWYDPSHPSRSALEKRLPMGLLVRGLICYGVLIYFFYLYKVMARV